MNNYSEYYRVVPCTNGACAFLEKSDLDTLIRTGKAQTTERTVLLPGGIREDSLLPGSCHIFADSIQLTTEDLESLKSCEESYSFTCYGPAEQDKAVNEDFALSGQFMDEQNRVCARFSVIADGISNGFAFPQRGAQISCFAAYQCLKASWNDRWACRDQPIDNSEVQNFRDQLTDKIHSLFNDDFIHLINQMVEPAHISAKVWKEKFLRHPERWYGNTLLISFVSLSGGFVLFIGDGAIVLVKGDISAAQDVIRSDDDSQISAYVTTELTSSTISGAAITTDGNTDFVEIITASDGLDRTLSRADRMLVDLFHAERSTELIANEVLGLDQHYPEYLDVDNYSIARIFFEFQPSAHHRLTGRYSEKQIPLPMLPLSNSANNHDPAVQCSDSRARQQHYAPGTDTEATGLQTTRPETDEPSGQKRHPIHHVPPILWGFLMSTVVVTISWSVWAWLDNRRHGNNNQTPPIEQVQERGDKQTSGDAAHPIEQPVADGPQRHTDNTQDHTLTDSETVSRQTTAPVDPTELLHQLPTIKPATQHDQTMSDHATNTQESDEPVSGDNNFQDTEASRQDKEHLSAETGTETTEPVNEQ